MNLLRASASAALLAWLLLAAPCLAASTNAGETSYALNTPPSSLEVGCQGPCACAIWTFPTFGSFVLVKTGVDPLYTYYALERYIASFNNGPGAVAITGSGRYKIGGEVALVQQLTLDLDIQGQPTEHFDSGLVPVSASFPKLHIACAVHGFYCYDSVLVVDASPIETAGAPPPPTAIEAIWPNPSTGPARISFTLARSGPVELMIFDVTGRRVRTLTSR